jgi:hypothetical protein
VDLHTVTFDKEQLETMASVNVPVSLELVLQVLGKEPNAQTIGPYRVGDTNFRTIIGTHRAMYMPYQYMSLLLYMELTGTEQRGLPTAVAGNYQQWAAAGL